MEDKGDHSHRLLICYTRVSNGGISGGYNPICRVPPMDESWFPSTPTMLRACDLSLAVFGALSQVDEMVAGGYVCRHRACNVRAC